MRNYKITITGFFDYGSHTIIEEIIRNHGGVILATTNISDIQLLIVGNQTDAQTRIIIQADKFGKTIVNENWLFSTIYLHRIADPMQYLWNTPHNQGNQL